MNKNDGSSECSLKSTDKYIYGTILPYEYIRASLDENCKNMFDLSCINFNYFALDNIGGSWTVTANPKDTHHSYSFSNGNYYSSTASSEKYVYPTVYLSEYTFYKQGNGTIDEPYRLTKKAN